MTQEKAEFDNKESKPPTHSEKEEMIRMFISPQDPEGNTSVTLSRNGKEKEFVMQFDLALETLFALKVTYFKGQSDRSPK